MAKNNCWEPKDLPSVQSPTDITKTYTLEKLLGWGTFGCTYKAKDKNGQSVAVKIINIKRMKDSGMNINSLDEEIENVKRVSAAPNCNRYVACYYNHFRTNVKGELSMIIVMELIDGVNFVEVLNKTSRKDANWQSAMWNYTLQLIEGLHYLHSKGLAHQDIKPDNIMLETSTGRVKYIDFGLSCYKPNVTDTDKCPTLAGTFIYYPPEMILWRAATLPKSFYLHTMHDVWSLGTTLYQLWNKTLPFKFTGNMDAYAIEVVQYNFIPSISNGKTVDHLLNSMFLVGGVKGLKKSDIQVVPYNTTYLFHIPYRSNMQEILNYVIEDTSACSINNSTLDRANLIELLRKFNIPYTIDETKSSLCNKVKNMFESCTVKGKNLNRDQLVIMSKLLSIDHKQSNTGMCKEIESKVANVQLGIRLRVVNVLEAAITNASIAKAQGNDSARDTLVKEITFAVSTILEVNPKVLDYGALLCKYRESRMEYIKFMEKKDDYNAEVKRNEANLIVIILKTTTGGEMAVDPDSLTIPKGSKIAY